MKIVLLYLGRTGAGPTYSIEFAKALLKEGINIYAIVSSCSENINDWRTLSKFYVNGQFELKEIYTYKSNNEFLYRSLNIHLFISLIYSIKRYAPDFILSTMVHPWHNIIFLFLKNTAKRIKIIHDVKPHKGEDSLLYRILNFLDIHLSDLWIVLTKIAAKQMMELGIDERKIYVIPHANFGCYSKGEIELSSEIFYRIAFIGRINKYKGLDVLLTAFRDVRHEIPRLRLLIAGSGNCDEYASLFEELKDSLDLDLRWIPDEEIPSIIKKVDIVVLPYIEATQSGVIPLAFAFGKTVIATNVGGIAEQVPKNTGILVPPNDSKAVGNAILKLYRNLSLIKQLDCNAFIYANTELSWDKSADLFIGLCKENCMKK